MRKLCIFFTVLFFAFTATVLAADVTGNWDLNTEGPFGPEVWKITLNADGTAEGDHPNFGKIKGKNNSKGDKWDVTFELNTPMGLVNPVFVGTVSGNSAKGTTEVMGAPSEWTATKK